MRREQRFGISVLGEDDKGLMKPFFKGPGDGSPFDDVEHGAAPDLATQAGGLTALAFAASHGGKLTDLDDPSPLHDAWASDPICQLTALVTGFMIYNPNKV